MIEFRIFRKLKLTPLLSLRSRAPRSPGRHQHLDGRSGEERGRGPLREDLRRKVVPIDGEVGRRAVELLFQLKRGEGDLLFHENQNFKKGGRRLASRLLPPSRLKSHRALFSKPGRFQGVVEAEKGARPELDDVPCELRQTSCDQQL